MVGFKVTEFTVVEFRVIGFIVTDVKEAGLTVAWSKWQI